MIVTEVFLLFVAVPLACVAEETAVQTVPDGCTKISKTSFLNSNCESSLMSTLGHYCSMMFPDRSATNGQWLGTVNNRDPKCRVCCVYSDGQNIQYYNVTTALNSLPCAPKKKCKNGRCV
uniref:Putative secreted protein n=1 Tax=Ixodes ricinus TaxID=34613 RepID=V5IBG7_IXORI